MRFKQETQSTLSQHYTLSSLLGEGTQNFNNKNLLLKDKFSALALTQQSTTAQSQKLIEHSQPQTELKKHDLYDLGIVLLICATDGIDMVNEEHIS